MKNVGILSMQRVANYGSFLQAYALKQLLLQNGAENVFFIDIKPGLGVNKIDQSFLKRIVSFFFRVIGKGLSGQLFTYLREKRFQDRLVPMFNDKFYPMLELEKQFPGIFDLVVIGSDEVFNCTQRCSWGFSTQLFGDIPNAKKIISYAASFGHSTYEQIVAMGYDGEIRKNLKNLKAISVRDENSLSIVGKMMPDNAIPVFTHLDPVLIYDYSPMISRYPISRKDYIIIYSYNGRIKSRDEVAAIIGFAKARHLKIYSIYSAYSWCDEALYPCDPFEIISYFRNADFIVTDTFHGAVLSIITESRFGVLMRDSNQQKISSLLKQFDLSSRIAVSPKTLPEILETPINYAEVGNVLARCRSEANQYLKQMLAEE